MSPPKITFYHCPNTRSSSVHILLEELAAPYDLHLVNIRADEQHQPDFLAVNPMGKVPAIRSGDAVVTEQPAIFIYLADLFPGAGLAPALDNPLRGPYLRWMVYYAGCFEPALIDHHLKHEPGPRGMCPYGDYDTVVRTVSEQLEKGPYLLGEQFSAADVLWGTALGWVTAFNLFPDSEHVKAYIARIANRPAAIKAAARDSELAQTMIVPEGQPG